MKKKFPKQAVILIAILYSAIFWFDYKLKQMRLDPDAQPETSAVTVNAGSVKNTFPTIPTNFSMPGANPTGSLNTEISGDELKKVNEQVNAFLRKTENLQRFIENKGQMPAKVKYYSDANRMQLAVTDKSIRIIARKNSGAAQKEKMETHVVDLSFEGGNTLNPQPVAGNLVTYNYLDEKDNIQTNIQSYGELLLPNVYDGVSLRLYSNETGDVEFDWMVNNPEDYKKIQMKFQGQDYLTTTKKGELAVGLRFEEMKLHIPESYQVVDGEKKNVNFSFITEEGTASFGLAKNETLQADAPLVIDPAITYATVFGDEPGTLDHQYSAESVAKDAAGNVYAGLGDIYAKIKTSYVNNAPGYDQTRLNSTALSFTGVIVKLTGNICTGITLIGSSSSIHSIKLFPDGRLLFSGSLFAGSGNLLPTTPGAYMATRPAGTTYCGFVGVLSADLTTLHYCSYLPGTLNGGSSEQSGAGLIEILDNQTYFVGGCVSNGFPNNMPAGFISAGAPDASAGPSGREMYIARFSGAGYNTLDWATYVGGSGNEYFGGLKLTPDKTKLAFCGTTDEKFGWPAVTANNVLNTFIYTSAFIGTLNPGSAVPAGFGFLSYFGANNAVQRLKMDVSDGSFYLFYETLATTIPGTAALPAVYDATSNGGLDMIITKIPIDGTTSGTPVRTTYLGGSSYENSGIGIAVNESLNRVYVVGVSSSTNYPTVNIAGSAYFKGTFTPYSGGPVTADFVISHLTADLTQLIYSTFLGSGKREEYLPNSNATTTASNTALCYNASADEFTFIGLVSCGGGGFVGGTALPYDGFGPGVFGANSFDTYVPSASVIPIIINMTGSGSPCNPVAPVLSNNAISNTCPATTADLNSLHVGAIPAGSTLVWFTNDTHSGAAYATPTAATAGIYYAFYFNAGSNCYSSVSVAVTVTINGCPCVAGGLAPVLSANAATNICPATTFNLNSLHIGVVPPGASLVWFTNNTHTGVPYPTSTAATAGTYYAFYYDPISICFSPASSAVIVTNTNCGGVPDLTPSVDIDDLSFSNGQTKDFVVNLFELLNNSTVVGGQAVTIRINRISGWDITVPGLVLNGVGQSGSNGNSNVFGGTPNENGRWLFSQNAGFITVTLNAGEFISGGGAAILGFTATRKAGTISGTSQNITATIVAGSGGETDASNNVVVTTISAN